jgi:CBS domain-containing protein
LYSAIVMAPATITALASRRPGPDGTGSAGPASRVADVLRATVVRIPVWFTAAQARRVAALKGVDHLLVEEHGRVAGSVSVAALFGAASGDPVARCMSRSRAHLTPELSLAEAERQMKREGVSCLPVVTGGLLVGIVGLADVGGDIAHAA